MLTLEAPNPPLGGGGVEVNFGTSDVGSGDVQPLNDNAQQAVTNPPPSAAASEATPQKEQKIVTQDLEDAPAINQSKTTKVTKKHVKITKPVKTTTVIANTTPTTTPKVANTPPSPPAPTVDQRAIYKGAKGTTNNSTGEGTDKMPGDKGMPNGDPSAKGYTGTGGNGTGGTGKGIGNGSGDLSYNLNGREHAAINCCR